MYSLETMIMIAAIVFCVGALLGAIISRTLIPGNRQKGLEANLDATRNELNRYQTDVAEHFEHTSELVNKLTQSYKDVHQHLAKGAIQLTNAEIGQQILEAGEELQLQDKKTLDPKEFEAPKDWAPKSPGEKGTLSEEYGLDELKKEQPIEVATAQTQSELDEETVKEEKAV